MHPLDSVFSSLISSLLGKEAHRSASNSIVISSRISAHLRIKKPSILCEGSTYPATPPFATTTPYPSSSSSNMDPETVHCAYRLLHIIDSKSQYSRSIDKSTREMISLITQSPAHSHITKPPPPADAPTKEMVNTDLRYLGKSVFNQAIKTPSAKEIAAEIALLLPAPSAPPPPPPSTKEIASAVTESLARYQHSFSAQQASVQYPPAPQSNSKPQQYTQHPLPYR